MSLSSTVTYWPLSAIVAVPPGPGGKPGMPPIRGAEPAALFIAGCDADGDGDEATSLDRWAGLGRRYPVLGVVFSLFLLAFAGIPLTSGFVAKFAVFKAAGQGGAIPLVIVGVLASAIAAYFYVRVIVLMFFTDPVEDGPEVQSGALSTAMIGLTAFVTLALGAVPQPVLDLANHAGQFLR